MWRRRDVLRAGLAGAAALMADLLPGAEVAADEVPIIDAHTHFYDPFRPEGVPWPSQGTPLYRTVLPDDFRKLAEPLGIVGTVVVEASPWIEDNQWVLDLAGTEPFLKGLVGHLEPGTPEFAQQLQRFAANRQYRGIRVNSASLADGLEQPEFIGDLKRLQERNLVLDVNGSPELLPLVDTLATNLPELSIVINHVANVRNTGGEPDVDWAAGMRAAAKHDRVACKISALTEGASRDDMPAPSDPEFYRPLLDVVWDAFGEDRLMFGSNWPVCEVAGTLQTVVSIARAYFGEKDRTVQEQFFAENARRIYNWPEPNA
jgi:predicted TIM-barrel fold metal-dependent hydrolase